MVAPHQEPYVGSVILARYFKNSPACEVEWTSGSTRAVAVGQGVAGPRPGRTGMSTRGSSGVPGPCGLQHHGAEPRAPAARPSSARRPTVTPSTEQQARDRQPATGAEPAPIGYASKASRPARITDTGTVAVINRMIDLATALHSVLTLPNPPLWDCRRGHERSTVGEAFQQVCP